ncbi:uncharacterized protein [Antedon mediterranea]|uniref:uncharacterized protein isoform X2 n=1 Tax=Antedon mediterranea TaxID=105859 RepID=UPI003AF5D01D
MMVDTDDKFRDFCQKISNAYPGNKTKELRFLLHDPYLPNGVLAGEGYSGMYLFNELKSRGKIAYNDVNLVSEIADVTENECAKTIVMKYKQEIQCNARSISSLSLYRKTLYKAMGVITENKGGDLHKLIDYYGLNHQEFTNKWDLVFYLETELKLENTTEKLNRFAEQLNGGAKVILLAEQQGTGGATGGGEGSSSTTTRPITKTTTKTTTSRDHPRESTPLAPLNKDFF